ncbi:hypothetical protein BCR36DRAFT_260658, partial [Piromyces finnis]
MLSSNKREITDKSLNDNLKSYLNNLKINNPNEEINSDFLKNYLQKIEKQLEKENNLRNLESTSKSSINELEILRINWKKKFEDKNEEIQNSNIIKSNYKHTKRRKSSHRRSSGKIVVRESDIFLKGPWVLDEENEDDNFNFENENLKEGSNDNPIAIEENSEQLMDMDVKSLSSNSSKQFNSLSSAEEIKRIDKEEKNEIENNKKIEEKENEIKEIKNKTRKSEKIEKKTTNVSKKYSTFFNIRKYLFGFFGKNSNKREEKNKDEEKCQSNIQKSKEIKHYENRGTLSSSSVSSQSDNDNIDESKINTEYIDEKEVESKENKEI